MQPNLTKILRNKSLNDLTEDELSRVGFVRIGCGDDVRIIKKGVLEKRQGVAIYLLREENRDFLYSNSRSQLKRLAAGQDLLSEKYLAILVQHIKNLKSKGVPGIFKEEYETNSSKGIMIGGQTCYEFPCVDLMINLFCQQKRYGPALSEPHYAGMSKLEDIIHFKTYATYPANQERIILELNHRTRHLNYNFKSRETMKHVFEQQREVFGGIVEMLRVSSLQTEEPRKELAAAEVMEIIKIPFWYCYCSQTTISDTARLYKEMVMKEAVEKRLDFTEMAVRFPSHNLMMILFPEIKQDIENEVYRVIENKIKEVPCFWDKELNKIQEELGCYSIQIISAALIHLDDQNLKETKEEYEKRITSDMLALKTPTWRELTKNKPRRKRYHGFMEKAYLGVSEEIKKIVLVKLGERIKRVPGYDLMNMTELANAIRIQSPAIAGKAYRMLRGT